MSFVVNYLLLNNIIRTTKNQKINILCLRRTIHTSLANKSYRNPKKFPIPNKRGQFEHMKLPKELLENEFDYPIWRDTLYIRYPGVWFGRTFVYVPEMEPQLVVPDLDNLNLKPYVSYRTPDIFQSEFTARDLFNSTYADEVISRFKNGEEVKIEANEEDIKQAKNKAQQTGADLFMDKTDS